MASTVPNNVLSPDVFTPAVTRAHIAAITSRMNAVYGYLYALNARRNALKSHLDAYIYPVLTLPNEIISEIFLHTIPLDLRDQTPSVTQGPLLATQICRKWRHIALSSPRLWSSIALELVDVAAEERELNLLKPWLARSQDCLLSISLFYEPPRDPILGIDSNGSVEAFVDAIIPHSKRWQDLEIVTPMSDFMRIDITGEFPLLRTLTLGITNMEAVTAYPRSPTWPYEIFHGAPALTELALARGFEPAVLLPPWAQLTKIYILDADALTARLRA
ncbi:hypothetical protein B0H16DRAFT_1880924 [Mycena metata]|uniref:F-box domain-containing protein n=1 Tax=Mycena metata TaxID=1033252 RepID=A0AAD7JWP6_9AGAR|nr:hypothetical protein B0H16DRAFT_1880924 [Mycena metata]